MGNGLSRDPMVFAWKVRIQAVESIGDRGPEVTRIRRVELM